jgi:hypothetical protein
VDGALVVRSGHNPHFALDGESFPGTNILNEEIGLMPTLNNGPPIGSGGGGGTPYAGLGSLFPGAGQPVWETPGLSVDILDPLRNSPVGGSSANVWARGPWPSSVYPDHQSAYNIINYQLFGDAHTLDAMQMQSNRMRSIQIPNLYGLHAETGGGLNGGFTFPGASGTPPAGKTFYGQIYHGSTFSQGPRAGAWMARNLAFAAAMGADSNPLRKYFFDMVVENAHWWAAMPQHKDCSSVSPYLYQPGI